MRRLPDSIDMDEVLANSYKDFHQKGFDYICLKRSPFETLKLYFFDGDASKLPEVVSPHDHRYDFGTTVVAGASENVWFLPDEAGERYNAFAYRTPLNGGDGFTFTGEARLRETRRKAFQAGQHYHMLAEGLHTIRIVENETVLFLRQYEDRVPLDRPTQTFIRGDKAPSLDGLYSRFTADQVVDRLSRFQERTGFQFLKR